MANNTCAKFSKTSLAAALLAAISLFGCDNFEDINYDTQVNLEKLTNLIEKKIALISVITNNNVLTEADILDPSASIIVSDKLKEEFISIHSSVFDIIDASNDDAASNLTISDIKNTSKIANIIEDLGVDGGILISNAYGYKMKSASGLLWGIIESFIPKEHKKTYRAPLGHSEVEWYYFAATTYLLDQDGNIVWHFAGKAFAPPSVDFNVKEFLRSFAGMDPSSDKVARVMLGMGTYYIEFNRWLLDQDVRGSNNKNYFIDYPEERKNNLIALLPASEEAFPPTVVWNLPKPEATHEPAPPLASEQRLKAGNEARPEIGAAPNPAPVAKTESRGAPEPRAEIPYQPKPEIGDGGYPKAQPAAPSFEAIRRIQSLLSQLGYEPGLADGLMGPRTSAAIRAFQKDSGMAVTGEISDDLFALLTVQSGTTAKLAGSFAIQIAAFRSIEAAQQERERVQRSFSDLLGNSKLPIRSLVLDDGSMLYRLHVTSFPNRESAEQTCARLKARKQYCFVVQL